MNIVGGLVVFLIVWWLIFFMVLPWGVRTQSDDGDVEPGTEPGAPSQPLLVRKAIITTIITIFVWGVIYVAIGSGIIPLEPAG